MNAQDKKLDIILDTQRLHELRIKKLEQDVPDYPKISIPDYSNDLKLTRKAIESFLDSGCQKQMEVSMQKIRELVSRMPHIVKVEHHHHFAKPTRRVVTAFTVLSLLLAFTIWLAYYFYKH
ncbi:hypothetical protein [Pedobacter aquatilis]|uniref:hypothetical protein n=1 Tax=Pedobacter aquatilis TaxID=351343 RepID=UPI00292CF722|nr:hypothetical protein [Pedobacter aquatilis]